MVIGPQPSGAQLMWQTNASSRIQDKMIPEVATLSLPFSAKGIIKARVAALKPTETLQA